MLQSPLVPEKNPQLALRTAEALSGARHPDRGGRPRRRTAERRAVGAGRVDGRALHLARRRSRALSSASGRARSRCCPRRDEGSGDELVRAAARGVPSVALSTALGVADGIIPGVTGELALDDDPESVADAVVTAASLPVRRHRRVAGPLRDRGERRAARRSHRRTRPPDALGAMRKRWAWASTGVVAAVAVVVVRCALAARRLAGRHAAVSRAAVGDGPGRPSRPSVRMIAALRFGDGTYLDGHDYLRGVNVYSLIFAGRQDDLSVLGEPQAQLRLPRLAGGVDRAAGGAVAAAAGDPARAAQPPTGSRRRSTRRTSTWWKSRCGGRRPPASAP